MGQKLFRQNHDQYSDTSALVGGPKPVKDDNKHKIQTEELKVDKKLLVVAIDIGTTYSGYAFSFAHEQGEEMANPDNMHAGRWGCEGGSESSVRTPSCLLLQPDKSFDSFGYEAITKYNGLSADNEHRDWYFFWQFKMVLHKDEEIKENSIIKDVHGKEMETLQVFGYSIQYLKDHLMKQIRNSTPDLRDTDICWVITVPAIWNDSAKKFMRQAAEFAGIKKDQIEIALEPESAALYCRSMKTCLGEEQGSSGLTSFPVGTRYMVLDCGGGTVDVTVHEVTGENTLRELHLATGGAWGGSLVNKAFDEFISSLAGPETFLQFTTEYHADYLELIQEFDLKKRMTKPNTSEPVRIKIPFSLRQNLSENEILAKAESTTKLVREKLIIQPRQLEAFFDDAVRDILKHVDGLVKAIPERIDVLLLVGGFAESLILQKAIKDQFESKLKVVIPIEPSLSVMKGAVLYGFKPTSIAFRRSRYTYGFSTSMSFKQGKHPPHKKSGLDGKAFCDDIFDKHVEINQEIPTCEVISKRIYYPVTDNDKVFQISLYRSLAKNPKFVDEQDCKIVETVEIDVDTSIGKNSRERQLTVRTIFGASDIRILAEQKGGKKKEAIFKLNGIF